MTKQAQVVISLRQQSSNSVFPGLFPGLRENRSSWKHAVPTGGTRGEKQQTEDWACMATTERKRQFYFCKGSKNQQTTQGWSSERNRISFREATESQWDSSSLVELLSSLPESSKSKLISFFCQRGIHLPPASPATITWLRLMADNSKYFSLQVFHFAWIA